MLTLNDLETLKKRDISEQQINDQLNAFKTGFPFLEIKNAATVGNGIVQLSDADLDVFTQEWDQYLNSDAVIQKFVPASGAASRMFKDLFEFFEGESEYPTKAFEKSFFNDIAKFAFYKDLNDCCIHNEGSSIESLITAGKFKAIVYNLLSEGGLNYGALPKGLLRFHAYDDERRTPAQEHLVEGALYAAGKSGIVNLHFTVSKEHRNLFEQHINLTKTAYEKKYGVQFNISFSEQKPSTDTIAADAYNEPFRENDSLVFRPGGHGALIENLNDLEADVIFIKNIDNVVPDSLKDSTVQYKKCLAGLLVHIQQQCFSFLRELENEAISSAKLSVISQFCEVKLNNHCPDFTSLSQSEQRIYLYNKLNRPIRICGMVKNEGEPGGGPFLTVNSDGTISPQILESSQINMNNPIDKEKMMNATHFNPVDLICAVKNYKGEKFDLTLRVDKSTGFISSKSKSGKELKALELPGLWNGAMSDWNTIFVEVPVDTFNPVKTVNDLLRPQHQ